MARDSSFLPFRSDCRPPEGDDICVPSVYYVPGTAPGTQTVGTVTLRWKDLRTTL